MKTKAIPCPVCDGRGSLSRGDSFLWSAPCPLCNGAGSREVPLVMQNLRFGVEKMYCNAVPGQDGIRLYIRGEFDGKTYGTYVTLNADSGFDGNEVPAEVFTTAVRELQETMEQIEEQLQKDGEDDG